MNTLSREEQYIHGPRMPLLNSENWTPALNPRGYHGRFRYNGGRHRLHSGARHVAGTVFGGPYDPNNSAYTGKKIDSNQLGASLPYVFDHAPGHLPGLYIKITSERTGKSTIAPIVDVGPHKVNNPYWDIENCDSTSGDRKNHSGLDMTPATARALGLPVSRGTFGHPPAINTVGDQYFDF